MDFRLGITVSVGILLIHNHCADSVRNYATSADYANKRSPKISMTTVKLCNCYLV
ncbi:hypothetical protein FDUTEX481_00434 [Tolypothrix sp. PCC 7601]|nr:hypothetical protein FDUTEX481_00434 [Tolypothrix sp. PCC 7601]